MANEPQVEVDTEAEMARIEAEMPATMGGGNDNEEPVDAPAVVEEDAAVEVDDAAVEAEAKRQGHVDYDEWVRQGKDPRAWRPAAEYVQRGTLLKTPKPELIDQVEELRKAQLETARLVAEQVRISQEEQRKAEIRGYERAIQEARARQEQAHDLGDIEEHRKAVLDEVRAQQAIDQATAPQADPELLRWQDEAKWFKEGFTVDPYTQRQVPKNAAVETFLVFQKDYMLNNPGARLIDSVRYAEGKVKAAMPDHFRPKTVQQTVRTQQVEAGPRAAPRGADPLSKYPVAEQKLIKRMAELSGIPLKDYIKQMEQK